MAHTNPKYRTDVASEFRKNKSNKRAVTRRQRKARRHQRRLKKERA